ncbi:MAG: TetR/AcrR family transcriptional regulator [Candidatus Marinimicrobia bacterium]|nr:TetR/AcrR family transcriptional regulator [Candidatus Neomarinimicrobiota bacterium]MCF7827935.1 TetR/AcrR family transcriptional regulator [Candidatus Neomarinimicrobiota bacterium]MCF7879310.1 TetR/AcrR family transcriptional regulator [Candidatus Neomarinimicrobiota bacterium]
MSSSKAETRTAILQAARKLIEEQGPSAVRMQDIAEDAGISRQGLYLHFKSRTDLLLALVEWIDNEEGLGELAQWVWDADDGMTALQRFITLVAQYTHKIYPVAQSLMSGRYSDEAIAAAWKDRMTGRRNSCRKLIYWLQQDKRLNPSISIQEAIDLLWTFISVQVWEQLVIESGWSTEQYETHLQMTAFNSLCKR